MTRRQLQNLLFVGSIASFLAVASHTIAAEVRIRIVGRGGTAKYIGENDGDVQKPVNVNVGDAVVWKNEGNRAHTATAETNTGTELFDTGDIDFADSQNSASVVITPEIFANAGGQAGGTVTIDYFCSHHGSMFSSLVVADVQPSLLRIRRDITTLSESELNAYRDAWRTAQSTSGYVTVSGRHGCPDRWCHRDLITFLPWHREYVLQMEQVLGQPLHYWDWTAPDAAASGIPAAFTDATYVSADGNTYPNPLQSFTFDCSGPDTTVRFPDDPSNLSFLAADVQACYGATTYADFNASLNGPHGGLHVWINGHMGGTFFAGYDPIFWAHHSNVDRQWASWQRAGGPNPVGTELSQPLFGFSLNVSERLDPTPLGYEYDRYDSMPQPLNEGRVIALNQPTREARPASQGIGKTFEVPAGAIATNETVSAGELQLLVGGIPDHPLNSYSVYVFVNQPDATPEDAKPDNPRYAGYFGVFGTGQGKGPEPVHERPSAPKEVLRMFGGKRPKLNEPIKTITLVVTGRGRVTIPAKDIPFNSASIRQARPGAPAVNRENRAERRGGGEIFIGVSETESYDEAYRDAVNQAQTKLSRHPDTLIRVEVVSVEGERGGIAGFRKLRVKIRAWVN